MLKKIFTASALAVLCTAALAKPVTNTIDLNRIKMDSRYSSWDLNPSVNRWSISPTGWTTTFMLYVNKYIPNNGRVSDPVRFNCNGIPVIVNPGNGTFCTLPVGKTAYWEVEPDYYYNGASGLIFTAE